MCQGNFSHHYCMSLLCSCPALAAGTEGLFVRKFIEESEYDTYEREVNVSLAIPADKKHLFCAVVAHGRSIKYVCSSKSPGACRSLGLHKVAHVPISLNAF
jgi:hypothetical protein